MLSGEVLFGEVLSGEVLSGEVLFGEMLSGEVLSGEVLFGEVLSGEVLFGEVLSGEVLSGEVLSGEVLSGEVLSGEVLSGEVLSGEMLSETQLGRTTSLKRVLKEVRPQAGDDMTSKLQPLSALIGSLLAQADAVLSSRVFVGTARGLWDRHGREVLHFLEKRREGVSWFKSASAAITLDTLDNVFTQQRQRLQGHMVIERDPGALAFRGLPTAARPHSQTSRSCHPSTFPLPSPPHQTLDNLFTQQMQRLQGHSLMERDLEPPRAICDARGVLSKGGAPAATARVHDSLSLY
ncbi:unnamed protein product [Closterium sp. Naga37s-1]|nr:unnamed protein product [Closterium sp. Naga37s-1]